MGRLDRNHYFANPVNPEQAPGYLDIIERPMHWEKIKQKLEDHEYLNVQDFKVRSVCLHSRLFVTFNHRLLD